MTPMRPRRQACANASAPPAYAQVAPSMTEQAGYTGLFAAASHGDAAEIARLVGEGEKGRITIGERTLQPGDIVVVRLFYKWPLFVTGLAFGDGVLADPAKFGTPAEKRRLLARWQREIGDALK